ncbi:MAG: ABC transporter substrate-binding protein [Thermoleophilia bacterium]
MRRNRLAIFLVGLLVLLLAVFLVACPEDEEVDTTETTEEEVTETTEEVTETTEAEDISGQTVNVLGVWGGPELEGFEAVVAGWEEETGAAMEFEGTRDLTATLRTRVGGNNPPDLAILPNPALMVEFAGDGALVSLSDVVDMDQLSADYAETWVDLGTVDGELYGVWVKASAKSTVWYNPVQFEAAGYEIPETWDEMIALSDQIVADGDTAPWSVGLESGAASGWPGTDWIQEILLHESGPEVYDQWVNHEIPWTDDAVRSAWEKFGTIVTSEGYLPGGSQFAVSTSFQDASYLPFQDPPRAYLYFLGAFTAGFIADQFPDLTAGEDYDFFRFPTITDEYAGAATGSGDILVMFNDTPAARSLVQYLANAENWAPWAELGGYTSPSGALDPNVYPSELVAKTAQQLTEASVFRFDADDLMPAEVQQAYFQGVMQYVQNPDQLDDILQNLEDTAVGAYGQ